MKEKTVPPTARHDPLGGIYLFWPTNVKLIGSFCSFST
ncbi:hypothetical protein PAV_9c01850 [Paenibacillus alvei DSM 29]|nr:hypothetical protein PAV_9c01850 [Paenibacillus alvei DSM 29]